MPLFHADTFSGGLRPERRGRKPVWKGPCRTKGCPETKTFGRGRCRRCYFRLYADFGGPFWPEDVGLEWGRKCCFQTCDKLGQGNYAGGDLPLCEYHQHCVHSARWLEGIGYSVSDFLWDLEWLTAREYSEMRLRAEEENRHLFDRIYGDTPLFRIFMHLNKFYLPLLHSL